MKILSITILTGNGPDSLSLNTDLPEGRFPYEENASFTTFLAAGGAERYAKEFFPDIPYKIIQLTKHQSNFSGKMK